MTNRVANIAPMLIAYASSMVNTLAVSSGYMCIVIVSYIQLIGAHGSIFFNTCRASELYLDYVAPIMGGMSDHTLKITNDVEFIKGHSVVYATTMG